MNGNSTGVEPTDPSGSSNPLTGLERVAERVLALLRPAQASKSIGDYLYALEEATRELEEFQRQVQQRRVDGQNPENAGQGQQVEEVIVCRHHKMIALPNPSIAGHLSCGCIAETGQKFKANALPHWLIRTYTVNGQLGA